MLASFKSEDTFTPDDGLVLAPTVSRQITLLSGQNLKRGSVLGKITTGGKYVLSLSASSDGSQTPAVILAEDCDASAGDKVTVAYFGGSFDENACVYGTGHTAITAREPLRDVSILLQSSLKR